MFDRWTKQRQTNWREDTIRQFRNVLAARYRAALGNLSDSDRQAKHDIVTEIDQRFAEWESEPKEHDDTYSLWWRNAHSIEQLICFVQQGPLLDAEVGNRLLRLQGLPGAAERKAAFAELKGKDDPAGTASKQALLFNIVVDMQNRSQRRAQIRHMRLRAVSVVSWVALAILLLVASPVLVYVADFLFDDCDFINDFIDSFPNLGLFTAVSFGALGALFSRFLVLQDSQLDVPVDEAAAFYRTRYILLRVLVGSVGAIIVYFFLGSGLIEGDLAPKISALNFGPTEAGEDARTYLGTPSFSMVASKDMALLIVWSFLAGFSERLVPNLLKKAEERTQAGSPTPPPASPPA